jgi:hypothetical protein
MKIPLRYILTVLLLTGLLEGNYWAQAQEKTITTRHQDFEQEFIALRKEQPEQELTGGGLFYKLSAIRTGMAVIVKE